MLRLRVLGLTWIVLILGVVGFMYSQPPDFSWEDPFHFSKMWAPIILGTLIPTLIVWNFVVWLYLCPPAKLGAENDPEALVSTVLVDVSEQFRFASRWMLFASVAAPYLLAPYKPWEGSRTIHLMWLVGGMLVVMGLSFSWAWWMAPGKGFGLRADISGLTVYPNHRPAEFIPWMEVRLIEATDLIHASYRDPFYQLAIEFCSGHRLILVGGLIERDELCDNLFRIRAAALGP